MYNKKKVTRKFTTKKCNLLGNFGVLQKIRKNLGFEGIECATLNTSLSQMMASPHLGYLSVSLTRRKCL